MKSDYFFAPAKVNLILKVLNRRLNGFHEIFTLMQPVSLFDIIFIKLTSDKKITLTIINNNDLFLEKNNLIYKAAKLFFSFFKKPLGANIRLIKNIPIAAGLGGGSSDAANTLLGLNTLLAEPFSLNELSKMAAQLGSDVPFFIFKKTAIATGRGEKLKFLPFSLLFWYIIVSPPIKISTAWAYQQVRLTRKKFQTKIICAQDIIKHLQNDLETGVKKEFPEIQVAKERLKVAGAKHVIMSGSGGSVIAVFKNKKEALAVKSALKLPKNWQSFLVKGL